MNSLEQEQYVKKMEINEFGTNLKSAIKKTRWNIPDDTKSYLIDYFNNVTKFPTKIELKYLADKFGVKIRQIRIFFQNRRQRTFDIAEDK